MPLSTTLAAVDGFLFDVAFSAAQALGAGRGRGDREARFLLGLASALLTAACATLFPWDGVAPSYAYVPWALAAVEAFRAAGILVAPPVPWRDGVEGIHWPRLGMVLTCVAAASLTVGVSDRAAILGSAIWVAIGLVLSGRMYLDAALAKAAAKG